MSAIPEVQVTLELIPKRFYWYRLTETLSGARPLFGPTEWLPCYIDNEEPEIGGYLIWGFQQQRGVMHLHGNVVTLGFPQRRYRVEIVGPLDWPEGARQ